MKIEIGESLIYSWLRHVNGCQMAQANWTASLDSWQMDNVDELNKLMSDWAEWFDVKYEDKVFKRTSSLKQLLRQAEIDVLGIKFADASQRLYAVDIAVHGGGLSYGDKRETASRVAKKMLRSAMCLHAYLPGYQADIILASPYITPATLAPIQEYVADVQAMMHKAELPYTVSVLANDDFLERILRPVINISGNVEDTTELFVRSLKLYERFFPPSTGRM